MYICTAFEDPSGGGIFSFPAMDSPAPGIPPLSLNDDFHEQKGEDPENIMIGRKRAFNRIKRMDSLMQAVEVLLEKKPTVEIMETMEPNSPIGSLDHIPISLSPLGGKSSAIPNNIFSRRPSTADADVSSFARRPMTGTTGRQIVKASRPKKAAKRHYRRSRAQDEPTPVPAPAPAPVVAAEAVAVVAPSIDSANSSVTLDPFLALPDVDHSRQQPQPHISGLFLQSDAESKGRKRKTTDGPAASKPLKRGAIITNSSNGPNMTRSERLRLRKQKNRESAARSRQKRLDYQEQLEMQTQQLESTNEKLFSRLVVLSRRGVGKDGDKGADSSSWSLLKRASLLRRHSM